MESVKGSFRKIKLSTKEVDQAIKEYIERYHDPVVVFRKDYDIVYDADGATVNLRYIDK